MSYSSDDYMNIGLSDDPYNSSDYDDDDWNTSDPESIGFFTGTRDDLPRIGVGGSGAAFVPPIRVHANGARIDRPVVPSRNTDHPMASMIRAIGDYALYPRQKGETDLAFKIRGSQWKDVRGLLGPRAMAAGCAGVRLVPEPSMDKTGKGKGKAPAKGGSESKGAENETTARVHFYDLANAISLRAPADVLLALLAVAAPDALRLGAGAASGGAKRGAAPDIDAGASLLHFAVLPAHPATRDAKARASPTPVSVVKRVCELDPGAVCVKAMRGHTPMYLLARFGMTTTAADRTMAQTVDALSAVSAAATPRTSATARAGGGAAVLVSEPIRGGRERSEEEPPETDPEPALGHARTYPLHVACARHHGQTVRAILRAFPRAAAIRADVRVAFPRGSRRAAREATAPIDTSPGFPLHLLLAESTRGGDAPDLATFKAVLDAHPDAAKAPAGGDRRRRRPAHVLHALCSQGNSPARLVRCLLKAVPETARIVERGETALHCALDSDALRPMYRGRDPSAPVAKDALDIARAVLGAYPEACSTTDGGGAYPAHLAVENRWPASVCVEVLRAFPGAGTALSPRDGTFPLHRATRDGAVDVVRAVAAAFPELARAQTEEDGLPLHVAARHSAPDAVTRALLECYPEGARVRDSEGALPLHVVCASLGSEELMLESSEAWESENDRRDYENAKLLYAAFPEGAFHTDARGKTPAERLPLYDIHRMLSRDVFGGDTWRGEGWRIVREGAGDAAAAAAGGGGASPSARASGAALLVRVAANELAVAAMSADEIERLTVALDRARAAVSDETVRRPFEEALLAEHDGDEKWMCPIGYGLFRDPVIAGDGHAYERSNIVKWQEKFGAAEPRQRRRAKNRTWKSPMTGLPCDDFALEPAAQIRRQIDEKLDAMMRSERRGGEAAADDADGADGAARGKAAATEGRAKAATSVPRGTAGGKRAARGAKRVAERATATRATRARR